MGRKGKRKINRNLKAARFCYQTSVEEIDFQASRSLDKTTVLRLADCSFIKRKEENCLNSETQVVNITDWVVSITGIYS